MTVRITDEAFKRRLMGAVERGLGQQGAYTQGAIQQKIGRSQPVGRSKSGRTWGKNPSLPGEPPKKVTGELQRSIAWATESDTSSVALQVGMNLPYGRYLEEGTSKDGKPLMAPRPYLRVTLIERLKRIQAGVAAAVRAEFKL